MHIKNFGALNRHYNDTGQNYNYLKKNTTT